MDINQTERGADHLAMLRQAQTYQPPMPVARVPLPRWLARLRNSAPAQIWYWWPRPARAMAIGLILYVALPLAVGTAVAAFVFHHIQSNHEHAPLLVTGSAHPSKTGVQ